MTAPSRIPLILQRLAGRQPTARATVREHQKGLVVEREVVRSKCYVLRGTLTRRLTSVFGERKNRPAMITAIRKQLDTCFAAGCYSPSWSHSLLGEFQPRVNAIEF